MSIFTKSDTERTGNDRKADIQAHVSSATLGRAKRRGEATAGMPILGQKDRDDSEVGVMRRERPLAASRARGIENNRCGIWLQRFSLPCVLALQKLEEVRASGKRRFKIQEA